MVAAADRADTSIDMTADLLHLCGKMITGARCAFAMTTDLPAKQRRLEEINGAEMNGLHAATLMRAVTDAEADRHMAIGMLVGIPDDIGNGVRVPEHEKRTRTTSCKFHVETPGISQMYRSYSLINLIARSWAGLRARCEGEGLQSRPCCLVIDFLYRQSSDDRSSKVLLLSVSLICDRRLPAKSLSRSSIAKVVDPTPFVTTSMRTSTPRLPLNLFFARSKVKPCL